MNKENKLVPKLRFPEFANEGEWEEPTLGEISDRIDEKVGTKKLTTVSISAGLGFVSQAEKFSRDISGQQYKNYIVLRKGEYAYNKGNSKKFPQGCIYKLKEFDEVAAPNAFISFKFKDNYIGNFYQGYFDNNYHGKQLQRFITSGARMDGLLNIKADDFFTIVFPTPKNKAEQKKIASCLSSIDELIAAHTDKLEALKDHKKGLMQQLFPAEGETIPKLRFKEFENDGEWVEKNLGELGEIITGNTPSTNIADYYGGTGLFVSPADISSNRYIIQTKTTLTELGDMQTRRIRENSILFVCIGSTIGKVAQNKYECATNQQINSLIPYDDYCNDFIYSLLENKASSIALLAGKQAVPIINKTLFSSVKVYIPKPKEQQKIANFLSSIDDEIAAQTQKIEALKEHKRGLMQGLFPVINE